MPLRIKRALILVVSLSLLWLSIVAIKGKDIETYFKDLPQVKSSEILSVDNINDNCYIIFFVNDQSAVSCAIIQESWFTFDLLRISSQLPLNSHSPYTVMGSMYKYDNADYQIIWGISYSKDINQVSINECDTIVVPTEYNFLLFYLIEPAAHELPLDYNVILT